MKIVKFLLIFFRDIFRGIYVCGLENRGKAILVKFSKETADKPKEGIHIFELS